MKYKSKFFRVLFRALRDGAKIYSFRELISMYDDYSICVVGAKGSGKDVVTGNIINRRPFDYVSNVDYSKDARFNVLDFETLKVGGNTRRDFVNGTVKYYDTPYKDGTDIYISDVNLYFPAQDNTELDKEYPYLFLYEVLSRQLHNGKIHMNCQKLSRCYIKLREFAEMYIHCERCGFLNPFGLVCLEFIIYDNAESCNKKVKPPRITSRASLFPHPDADTQRLIYLDNHYNTYGKVSRGFVIFRNKSKHDTRYFKNLLLNGKKVNTERSDILNEITF